MKYPHLRGTVAVLLTGFAGAAAAHTGHGTESFFAGLAHPFGLDHLLAMVAVGLWSVFALPAGRAWAGPATFLTALALGAALGAVLGTSMGADLQPSSAASGLAPALLEAALAASVVLFGALLVGVAQRGARGALAGLGLGLIAVAAVLHGVAHGAEAPGAAGFASYAAGFMLTCAGLHLSGTVAGWSLRHWLAQRARPVVGGLGLACGGAGLVLLLSI